MPMKISLAPNRGQPLDPARATNCAVINLAATPGLGSWIAGRVVEAVGQLILSVSGFCLIIAYLVQMVVNAFKQLDGTPPETKSFLWLLKVGGGIFVLAWIWSLFTSISVWREAKRNAAAKADK